MARHYLEIDYKNSCFYEYSAKPKDGFKETTSSTGNTHHIKLYDKGVFGKLVSVDLVDKKRGDCLVLKLVNGEEEYHASIPLYDQRGEFDNRFAEPLIGTLPSLKKNAPYRVFPWSMEVEGYDRKMYGISIKDADLETCTAPKGDEGKVIPKYTRKKKDEEFDETKHFPQIEFKVVLNKKKPTADSLERKRDFLANVVSEALDRLSEPNTDKPNPKQAQVADKQNSEPKQAKAPSPTVANDFEEVITNEDYDDLPF